MDKLNILWKRVRSHKYLITLVVFGAIIIFFDENSIMQRMQYKREQVALQEEIDHYRKEFEECTRRLNELAVDSESIERIAREKYFMKKPNEDNYVFEDDVTE